MGIYQLADHILNNGVYQLKMEIYVIGLRLLLCSKKFIDKGRTNLGVCDISIKLIHEELSLMLKLRQCEKGRTECALDKILKDLLFSSFLLHEICTENV